MTSQMDKELIRSKRGLVAEASLTESSDSDDEQKRVVFHGHF